jgi:hypothetical protein
MNETRTDTETFNEPLDKTSVHIRTFMEAVTIITIHMAVHF